MHILSDEVSIGGDTKLITLVAILITGMASIGTAIDWIQSFLSGYYIYNLAFINDLFVGFKPRCSMFNV